MKKSTSILKSIWIRNKAKEMREEYVMVKREDLVKLLERIKDSDKPTDLLIEMCNLALVTETSSKELERNYEKIKQLERRIKKYEKEFERKYITAKESS